MIAKLYEYQSVNKGFVQLWLQISTSIFLNISTIKNIGLTTFGKLSNLKSMFRTVGITNSSYIRRYAVNVALRTCVGRLMAGFEFGDWTLQTAPDVDIFFCWIDDWFWSELYAEKMAAAGLNLQRAMQNSPKF